MRPHSDYVLVGRRAALTRDFATMLDDLRSALHRLDPATAETAQSVFERSGPARAEDAAKKPAKPQTELNDETLNDDR